MSLEIDIERSPNSDSESFREYKRRSKISYTRDFLLSLSESDVCKKLPSGFDLSLLSEFEDAYIQDRHRIPGSLPLQSHRRTDYSSSPPTRGDSSNYSRGTYGRWDTRSSGWNERDSDSQSDKDSDFARRYGNQSRRPWQSSEHDGLLGSGSFARPPGYASGLSGPKGRPNDQYQLNRSNEPYHPPRPYKAVPHSRRETTDSLNDETFGSAECASQDRAEEERRRRESFELMRKEQHKALQEKQKLTTGKLKDDLPTDMTELLENTEDKKRVLNKIDELGESVSTKSSLQIPGARPLVPPGFRSTIVERNSSTTSMGHSRALEAGRPGVDESISHAKAIVQNGTLDNQEGRQLLQKIGFEEPQRDDAGIHPPSLNRSEHIQDISTDIEISNGKLSIDNKPYRTSSLSEDSETQSGSGIVKGDTKKVSGHDIIDNSKQDQSSSILDKLFGSALTESLSGSSGVMEHQDTEKGGPWTSNAIQSSKFAQWFLEDENKGAEDPSYTRPSNLLSLIVGSEGGTPSSDVKSPQHMSSDLPFTSSEIRDMHSISNMTPTIGISGNLYNTSKEEEAVPPILTCEDLEQTILLEYGESGSTSQPTLPCQKVSGLVESKADTDDHASQHLLSLLQKGTGLKDMTVSSNTESGSLDKKGENVGHSGKTLTLETLFGSAFMKELQSAEAPVSAQRGSVGSAVNSDINGSSSIEESSVLPLNQRQHSNSSKIESWLGINDTQVTQVEVVSSKHQNDIISKHGGFDGAVDIQLPEEESLIAVGDSVNTPNSIFTSFGNSIKGESQSSNRPVDISDKLAALSTVFKDERPFMSWEGVSLMHGPYGPMEHEIPFHNVHAQPSSPQFRPTPQMNNGRPFFHPLDSHPTHVSSQMNLMAPESTIHRGAPSDHQFPANMMRPPFRHPNAGLTGFDPPHPMLQQMQMQRQRQTPNNFPHHLQEIARGAPLPPHLRTHATGSMQELNPIQGFPFDQQQPNFGSPGMALQAPEVGGNHPEAFQKLLEMELRANSSKRMHPFASLGHSQGPHGHELDMGFRFR